MNKLNLTITNIMLILFLLVSHSSCQQPQKRKSKEELYQYIENSSIYYNLRQPTQKYFLPYVLEEVSGLSYLSDNQIFMIEDEGGKAYLYDMSLKELVRKIAFSKPGDFEGIELVRDTVYITKSNGDLYKFKLDSTNRAEPIKINTAFKSKNNIEGLGYDPISNCLLFATKATGDIEDNDVKGKAIYSYSLKRQKIIEKTEIPINSDKIMSFLSKHKKIKYDDDQKLDFKPSGIAFHPIEKAYYVISANDRFILVIKPNGKIKATYPIRSSQLLQPEGITFTPEGDLLISSEGQGEKGYILRFEMLQK
ncbi:SdiA-regulated domain-containing protein [Reichenbachiella versicolor]|uniref:SdiA-regulated domain-containing protein n=1 Tax=Reichenbachiella versicolor TaxID=1821036 RepID=UPI000D6E58CC|nr:SdiA-regulated domain-containing protein [Reichenbachiella versicolor]